MEQPSADSPEPIKLVIVDQSKDALDAARDQADRRLDRELGDGSGFKRFINGIWKGNIAKDYYRQKYTLEARSEIESAQDVLFYDASEDRRGQAIEATIERFQSEHEELIHEGAGENREILATDNDLVVGMKDLIRRYCAGELNDETLVEERTRLLNAHQEINGLDGLERGIVTVDNLLETARAVAGAIENGESLDNTLDSIQVISGEARDGVRSEAQYNSIDRVIDKMARSKVGSLVGPEVIATAVTVAASIARLGSHSVVGAVTKTVLPGVAAGLWAGLRENRRMKDERSQHAREMAQGREFDDGATRRVEMEETRYDTVSANELAESLRSFGDSEVLDIGGNDALRAAIDALAAVNARIQISDSENIDLITFSNSAAVGDERMALDVARAELRVALDSRLNEESRKELGFEDQDSIGDIVNKQSAGLIEFIRDDISSKDKAFNRLKNRNVAKAAITGIVSGLVIGQVFQEGMAAIDPTRAGLIEQLWGAKTTTIGGVENQTILHGLFAGNHTTIHTGPSSEYSTHSFGKTGELSVSSEHSIVTNENGTLSLVDPNGHVTAANIIINKDGSLPQSSIDQLSKLGMVVNDKSFNEEIITTHSERVSAHDFIKNHLESTTRVKRDLWYDNDTHAPNYDKNELGLHWGGDNGITDKGYQFSVAGMTADGSYHGGNSVDWADAAKHGNLRLAISGTGDTQNQVFMVNVGANGKIDIPSDSPAAKFFSNEGGKAVFNGRYAEVVQMTGADAKGVEHMRPLATLVGDKHPGSIIDQVSKTTIEHHNVYEITTPGYDTIQENFTEMSPVIPIQSRRSMEATQIERKNGYYYGGDRLSPEEEDRLSRERSPRLNENPEAILDTGTELDWYRRQIIETTDRDYSESIDLSIANSPELSHPKSGLRAVVVVPVRANGEADNIYHSLSLYAQQDPAALEQSMVLLHVNWADSDEDDPIKMAAINKTKEEIERARRDFPSLTIAVTESIWSQEKIDDKSYGNGIIGHVARKAYDTAMMSVQKGIADGILTKDQEVLLIRNDADAQGIDRHYLINMISAAEQHPESDVFTGAIRWETARHSDLPGFAFISNFREIMHITARRKRIDSWSPTVGINTAVRMSTFAAVGGIGHDRYNTGAGSDDLSIGERVSAARNGKPKARIFHYGRLFGPKRNKKPTYDGQQPARSQYAHHRHVIGTGVDSKADRVEAGYLSEGTITGTWSGFDQGGYSSRDQGLDGLKRQEDFSEPKDIIANIERNMSSMLTSWYNNQAQISAALAMMIPVTIKGQTTYEIRKSNGHVEFKFSDAGAKWVIDHLQNGRGGRVYPIGRRVRSNLYGESDDGDRLTSGKTRFVQ